MATPCDRAMSISLRTSDTRTIRFRPCLKEAMRPVRVSQRMVRRGMPVCPAASAWVTSRSSRAGVWGGVDRTASRHARMSRTVAR